MRVPLISAAALAVAGLTGLAAPAQASAHQAPTSHAVAGVVHREAAAGSVARFGGTYRVAKESTVARFGGTYHVAKESTVARFGGTY